MRDKVKILKLEIYEKTKQIKNLKKDIKSLHEEINMIEGYKHLEKPKQKTKRHKEV